MLEAALASAYVQRLIVQIEFALGFCGDIVSDRDYSSRVMRSCL